MLDHKKFKLKSESYMGMAGTIYWNTKDLTLFFCHIRMLYMLSDIELFQSVQYIGLFEKKNQSKSMKSELKCMFCDNLKVL